GMDYGLRMDDDADRVGRDAEEKMRLDDLQSFVHHRGGVDRDLWTHLPGRVRQGILDGDGAEARKLALAERSSGGRQDQRADLFEPAAPQRLMDRAVLGIDRKELCSALLRFRQNQ